MEIRAFAEAVLLSDDLDLKLAAPASFTDERPGVAIDCPESPGRPPGLSLRSDKPVPPSPTLKGLEDPRMRGLALHSFAHHELQALELMALALLRFPDAPTPFRRGLVKILTDEQRHFRLYQERAEYWGVGMGEVGMGHFFWDTVATLNTPADFLAALSLTYEQANLDFAVYWAKAFEAVDDVESARVLTEVYEDEISHVHHGVAWFKRLNGSGDFDAYAKRLIFPLSPGRGKGPIFNREGRRRAGMSASFVDEMEITNVSRGRPPRVFSFDPFVEERAAGRTPKPSVTFVQRDLASVPMFLAHREDVVISPRPSLQTLRRLHRLGIEIPQFVDSAEALADRLQGDQAPWGVPERVAKLGKDKAVEIRHDLISSHPNDLWAADPSVVVQGMAAAQPYIGKRWVAKAPLSASGQHRIMLDHDGAEAWLNRHLEQGPVVLEPWFDRCLDLSLQLEIRDGEVHRLGVTRFWTTAGGAYRGSLIGPWSAGLTPDILRQLHGGTKRSAVNEALALMGEVVGAQLLRAGHTGPAGIDAMVVRQPDGLRLLPVLEINPRYTMGRVALQLHKQTGLRGGWFMLTDTDLKRAGISDREQLSQAVNADPLLAFCTEPTTAERTLTVMTLDKRLNAARERWVGLGLSWPDPE